jgi:hypothetical protein
MRVEAEGTLCSRHLTSREEGRGLSHPIPRRQCWHCCAADNNNDNDDDDTSCRTWEFMIARLLLNAENRKPHDDEEGVRADKMMLSIPPLHRLLVWPTLSACGHAGPAEKASSWNVRRSSMDRDWRAMNPPSLWKCMFPPVNRH